jgi:protein TonB
MSRIFPPAPSSSSPAFHAFTLRQRRVALGAVAVAHGLMVWGLLQPMGTRREPPVAAEPLYVSVLKEPPLQEERAAPAVPAFAYRPDVLQVPMPEVVAAATVPPAPRLPEDDSPAAAALAAAAVPPAPSAAERLLPASALQYAEPPVLVYPRASRRAGEAGRVLLRVFVDEEGRPRQVLVHRSSGFARLDEAAIDALRKARFKPCLDQGRPAAGWALVPLTFELDV